MKERIECLLNFSASIRNGSAIKHQPRRNPRPSKWYFRLPKDQRKGRTPEELEEAEVKNAKY